MKPIHLILLLAAAAGAAFGGIAYFGEGTGVTGTGGALVAFAGACAVVLGGLLDMLAPLGRGGHVALRILLVIGAALTAFAAVMLLQYVFAGLMVLAAVAALALFLPRGTRRPA